MCGAPEVVRNLDYEFRVSPLDSDTAHSVRPYHGRVRFDASGISATTVTINENCTEVFIRFLGSSEQLSDSTIRFIVTKGFITEYSENFGISYGTAETTGASGTPYTSDPSETSTPMAVSTAATTQATTTTGSETTGAISIAAPGVASGVLIAAGVPPIAIVLGLLGIAVIVAVVLGILLHKSKHAKKKCYSPEEPHAEHAENVSFKEMDTRPTSPEASPPSDNPPNSPPSSSAHNPSASQHDTSAVSGGQCDVSSADLLPS